MNNPTIQAAKTAGQDMRASLQGHIDDDLADRIVGIPKGDNHLVAIGNPEIVRVWNEGEFERGTIEQILSKNPLIYLSRNIHPQDEGQQSVIAVPVDVESEMVPSFESGTFHWSERRGHVVPVEFEVASASYRENYVNTWGLFELKSVGAYAIPDNISMPNLLNKYAKSILKTPAREQLRLIEELMTRPEEIIEWMGEKYSDHPIRNLTYTKAIDLCRLFAARLILNSKLNNRSPLANPSVALQHSLIDDQLARMEGAKLVGTYKPMNGSVVLPYVR